METDVLIVGQGLAGSALAWRLAERGARCVVVDRGQVGASHVAAGLITPVTGKRLTLHPHWEVLWSSAEQFYRSIEHTTGQTLLHTQPALRLFTSPAEREVLVDRLQDAAFGKHARLAAPDELSRSLKAEHGGFWMPGAARLDVVRLLGATHRWLQDRDAIVHAELDATTDLDFSHTGVTAARLGIRAQQVVFCQGHAARQPKWLAQLPIAPVKGEVLTIHAPQLKLPHVVHGGIWVAPVLSGAADHYLVGATYDRERIDDTPTGEGRAELLTKLAAVHDGPIDVIAHRAAVRPAAADRRPLASLSPTEPRVAWLTGLGAKGSLWAPWYAQQLAETIAARIAC